MRGRLWGMISPGSLAAFSASVVPSLPSARAAVAPGEFRLAVEARPAAPQAASSGTGPAAPPVAGRVLPRGSLLDLRV